MKRLNDTELARWLAEDLPHGDLTTEGLGLDAVDGQLRFEARGAMRVALGEEAARLFELCGATAEVRAPSGSDAAAGDLLLTAQGPVPALLAAWKVAQTAMELASGIAGGAAAIVLALREAGFETPVACTRKTMAGSRALAVRAVRAGGAVMHRLGLSDTLLVFPEHRLYLSAQTCVQRLQALKRHQPEKRLVVEVGDPEDAMAMAAAGADVLQLERFDPPAVAALRAALRAAGLRAVLAPAGGVQRDNAVAYARAGADLLVSSAPYRAPPADMKVRFERL